MDWLREIGPWWGISLIFVIGSIITGLLQAAIYDLERKEKK
jgi:hypothetical protein